MQLEVGSIVEGKVTGITKFGAFVELPGSKTGMVHISEVASTYVNEISDFLTEGQTVKVKVIGITEEGKISLSIKKAEPKPERTGNNYNRQGGGKPGNGTGGGTRRPYNGDRGPRTGMRRDNGEWQHKSNEKMSFEDMMTKFKQASDDKMSDLKKYRGEVKRGSANRRSRSN